MLINAVKFCSMFSIFAFVSSAFAVGDLHYPPFDIRDAASMAFTFRGFNDTTLLLAQSYGQHAINLLLRLAIPNDTIYRVFYHTYPYLILFFVGLRFFSRSRNRVTLSTILCICPPCFGEFLGGSHQTTIVAFSLTLLVINEITELFEGDAQDGRRWLYALLWTLMGILITMQFVIYILVFIVPYVLILDRKLIFNFLSSLLRKNIIGWTLVGLILVFILPLFFNFSPGSSVAVNSYQDDIAWSYASQNLLTLMAGNLTTTRFNYIGSSIFFIISMFLLLSQTEPKRIFYALYLYALVISLSFLPGLVEVFPFLGFVRNPTKINLVLTAYILYLFSRSTLQEDAKKPILMGWAILSIACLALAIDIGNIKSYDDKWTFAAKQMRKLSTASCDFYKLNEYVPLDYIRPLGPGGNWYITDRPKDHEFFRHSPLQDTFYKTLYQNTKKLCDFPDDLEKIQVTSAVDPSSSGGKVFFSSGLIASYSVPEYPGYTSVRPDVFDRLVESGVLGYAAGHMDRNLLISQKTKTEERVYIDWSRGVLYQYLKMVITILLVPICIVLPILEKKNVRQT